MKQITFLDSDDAALCAAESPMRFHDFNRLPAPVTTEARGRAVRFARYDLMSLGGCVVFGCLLHRRFDLDVRPVNLCKNSRSRFFMHQLVVLVDYKVLLMTEVVES